MRPGHEAPWAEWREASAGARMAHGWILAGKRGLGKGDFARAAALELVSGKPAGDTDAAHPDVMLLSHLPKDDKEERKKADGKPFETKRNITVDQIRSMQRRLNTRPTLGDRRAIIIEPADDLEKSAANALLKSLEEPPAGTYFLLVTHRPARLLPTIRSRCRLLRFPLVPPDEVDRYLAAECPEAGPDDREAAIAAAGGSPGAALEFLQQDLGKLYRVLCRIAREGDRDFGLRGELANVIGQRPDRDRILATLDLARAVLAERLDETPKPDIPALVDAHAALIRLSAQAPTFNFDAGLLVAEIGTLLASAAPASEPANG